jgi:voltage-gated potassium channel
MLGSVVAVLGLCMFALPASILASGFSEEMRRQNFVSTWHLVAKVPFFTRLQATQIAEIAGLLKLIRTIKGEVLMREGDTGECMYFIVSGQVEVKGKMGTFVLKSGDFFGEIALIERCPRTATVKSLTRCQLLVLDARDFHKFVAHDHALLEVIWETARQRLAMDGHAMPHQPPSDPSA